MTDEMELLGPVGLLPPGQRESSSSRKGCTGGGEHQREEVRRLELRASQVGLSCSAQVNYVPEVKKNLL